MGQVLDVVPNHMGIARSRNRWWQDVLENGPSSRHAKVFDIDWQPLKRELADKVLLPILGDQYGTVLERGEIQLVYREGAFCLRYFDTTLPVAPRAYVQILRHRVDALTRDLGDEHPDLSELLSVITSLERLPARVEHDPERLAERQREKEIAKRRLGELVHRSEAVAAFIAENVRQFNGQPGVPSSFDLLDALLGDQAYRLAHWRVASEEINYRRFFDINELAAVRMEDPDVFEEAHRLVFRLLQEGAIDGLRIDHVDGLYDPGDYLRRLQARARELGVGDGDRPLFIVVEKILGPDEPLPDSWPVDGTTGYEFANAVNGLFVQQANARAFDEIVHAVHGRPLHVRRRRVPEEEADHAGVDGGRDERARASPEPLLGAQPPLPRLHAEHPGARDSRDHRVLPRLSHVRDGGIGTGQPARCGVHRPRRGRGEAP